MFFHYAGFKERIKYCWEQKRAGRTERRTERRTKRRTKRRTERQTERRTASSQTWWPCPATRPSVAA